jgi:chromosome segregation ATPase
MSDPTRDDEPTRDSEHTASPVDSTDHTSTDPARDAASPPRDEEAQRQQQRAEQAEQQLNDTRQQMEALQGELTEARRTIDHLERRQKIDQLLADADPIDTEAVRLLTEQAVQQMDEPDVQAAVAELRERRPYLFRQQPSDQGSAMAARVGDGSASSDSAAEHAAMSGDRRDLLRYLRLRRGQ